VCGVPKLRRKIIRLAEKYSNFGWDSAELQKYSAAAWRRLNKFGVAALGGGAGVCHCPLVASPLIYVLSWYATSVSCK